MMSREEIYAEVRSGLVEVSGLPVDDISPSSRLMEDLNLDSIDAIDVALRIEQQLGFDFKGRELRNVRTVQDIVDLVLARQAGPTATAAPHVAAPVE